MPRRYLFLILVSFAFLYSGLFLFSQAKTSAPASVSGKIEVLESIDLAPGVKYECLIVKNGRYRHKTHVIEANLMNPDVSVRVFKAKNNFWELDKLTDIVAHADSLSDGTILGAVNGSFWRAYTNGPIGPTIISGEPIELKSYKQWSSIFFDEMSRAYIDTFSLSARIFGDKNEFTINRFNRRRDSIGIVVYNRYGGDVIPYAPPRSIAEELDEELANRVDFDDSTETEIDSLELIEELLDRERSSKVEFRLAKTVFKYLDSPAINKKVRCLAVSAVDSGTVDAPENGFVVSYGLDTPYDYRISVGDTIDLLIETNVMRDKVFVDGLSATPRLVRKGRALHEAQTEGSRSRRFIYHRLPRTAIGVNKEKNRVIFAAIESGKRTENTNGASLQDAAEIMLALGAYDAMNLDGGGSSCMTLGSGNLLSPNYPDRMRKIAVGIGPVVKSPGSLKEFFREE